MCWRQKGKTSKQRERGNNFNIFVNEIFSITVEVFVKLIQFVVYFFLPHFCRNCVYEHYNDMINMLLWDYLYHTEDRPSTYISPLGLRPLALI